MIGTPHAKRRLPIFQEIVAAEVSGISEAFKSEELLSLNLYSGSDPDTSKSNKENFNPLSSNEQKEGKSVAITLHPNCSPKQMTNLLSKIGTISSVTHTKNIYTVTFATLKAALKAKLVLSKITAQIQFAPKPLAIANASQYTGIRKRKGNVNVEIFKVDTQRINEGIDTRTTIMVKNIPNKYTQEMLIETIDQEFRGTYNFLYLPIDFQNKCNVGYSFLNFKCPQYIVSFFERFSGKKWGRFNSKKVCALAYARIQGLTALVKHFETSEVMMQPDPRIRPVIIPN
eukprot:TRINITY_DN2472_c0_g1_i5.p1 TRINITY_DN2472_c0_g1~~TRINITY_DN2472_c0_g1_i5.p1  ORF type:complete len:286 (+),score=66.66 TRINITY_DN2472_c0_g1_i5:181-1038(+)